VGLKEMQTCNQNVMEFASSIVVGMLEPTMPIPYRPSAEHVSGWLPCCPAFRVVVNAHGSFDRQASGSVAAFPPE
jgi:hypothetical protein